MFFFSVSNDDQIDCQNHAKLGFTLVTPIIKGSDEQFSYIIEYSVFEIILSFSMIDYFAEI